MRKTSFPTTISVVDVVAEKTHFTDSSDIKKWTDCHKSFVAKNTKRKLVVATGSGHYIYFEKPEFTVNEIVKTYFEYCK